MRTAIGLLLAFAIGAGCRAFDVPVPSPHRIIGALLVLAITLGYVTVDYLLAAPGGDSIHASRGE